MLKSEEPFLYLYGEIKPLRDFFLLFLCFWFVRVPIKPGLPPGELISTSEPGNYCLCPVPGSLLSPQAASPVLITGPDVPALCSFPRQSVPAECLSSPSTQGAALPMAFACDKAAGVPTILLVTLHCPTPTHTLE